MKHIIKYLTITLFAAAALCSCEEKYVTYSDAEYVMFADTLAAYPVQKDVDFISIPVVSTVIKDYDRTFGVEIIDKESNAIETLHYRLESNTVTIKAGENRADVRLKGIYDNIEDEDSLVVCLQLVMNKNLEMPLYGPRTKVELVKVCPFDINDFTGWCMFTSMFLYQYSTTQSYQRLIYTEPHPTMENTIICRDWMADGYDVTMTFHPEDPLDRVVTMAQDQVMSDEGSFFGTVYGDNKLYVKNSSLNDSYFYSCGKYLFLWCEVSVKDLGDIYGTVGHFYNVMEWVSDEEADRLKREEGL